MRTTHLLCIALLWILAHSALAICTNGDGDSFYRNPGCGHAVDCNDGDPATCPEAPELWNGLDDDCSALTDDATRFDRTCDSPRAASVPCDPWDFMGPRIGIERDTANGKCANTQGCAHGY